MPVISVIIPSFNSSQFLQETTKSVLDQSFSDIEIILVDDGSTDSTKELFPEFAANGVICVSQPQTGASAARNHGLEIATGDYIQFLDADDLLHPEKLELQLASMKQHGSELSFTLWSGFTGTLETEHKPSYSHDYKNAKSGMDVLASFGRDGWFIPVHSWLTSRGLIEKAGYWNPSISTNDDGEYFSRVLCHCEQVTCVDQHLAHYRRENVQSLSRLNSPEKMQSAYLSWHLIHALVASHADNKALVYPQRAYYILYREALEVDKSWAKLFAHQFDKLNETERYPHIRQFPLFSLLVDTLGLYRGHRVHRVLKWFQKLIHKTKPTVHRTACNVPS